MKLRVLVVLLALIDPRVSGWSLFKASRAENARALLKSLKKGRSLLNKNIKVVPVGRNECGILLEGPEYSSSAAEVLCVDRSEFMTPEMGKQTDLGQAVENYFETHEEETAMHKNVLPSINIALYLCQCRYGDYDEANNRFDSYVATLPSIKQLRHLPVFWSSQALAELQASTVREGVETRKYVWMQEHQLIQDIIAEAGLTKNYGWLDEDKWFWARAIICSRAFTDDYTGVGCLVPYVDMMNHMTGSDIESGDLKCSWNIDSTGYHLRLPENIAAHPISNRLGISYGSCSNGCLLMNYGFSIFDDEHQIIHENAILSVKLPEASPDFVIQIWEADGLPYDASRSVKVAIGDEGPMESALSMCRVASAQDDAELSRMKSDFTIQAKRTSQTEDGLVPQMGATLCRLPFSKMNEIRALRMLARILNDSLGRYSTTLDSDNILLSRKRLSNDHRNAILVRRGEKQVIVHFSMLTDMALRYLENNYGDFNKYKALLEASLGNEIRLVE